MKVVILGCGFVGARAARLFAQGGWDVTGVTHSAESAVRLAGEPFRVVSCDVTNAASLGGRPELQEADAVISAVSSGRGDAEVYRRVYLEGLANALSVLRPKAVLFTSSTSVYGQTDGSWVTEESPVEPASATSRVLRQAEELALHAGGSVARLAGIYGPGRSVLLRKFMQGTAVIEGDGSRLINQIHADDAALALYHLIAHGAPPGIYNVSDGAPLTQRECYEWLARYLKRPVPPVGPIETNRKRGLTHKRVSPAKLRALGWEPLYLSLQAAVLRDPALLPAALADESGDAPT